MEFFMSGDVGLGTKFLEVLYIVIGFILIYTGVANFKEKDEDRFGTAIFWIVLGIIVAFGRWIPAKLNGALIIAMAIPAVLGRVSPGKSHAPSSDYTMAMSHKLGFKIFIPAATMGIFALIFALFTDLGALVGVGLGVIVAAIMLRLMNSDNSLSVFLTDNKRQLDQVGPLCMLPMFLASLGAVFTASGVGDVVASLVSNIIPQGNMAVGIIVYAVGMALFTMVMGNAFAAITVMTVGVGAPFVLALGADPVIVGSLALTCGYCGTLMTPMAANFNIVPVALLDMEDKYGVVKNQVIPAIFMLVFQIIVMIIFA